MPAQQAPGLVARSVVHEHAGDVRRKRDQLRDVEPLGLVIAGNDQTDVRRHLTAMESPNPESGPSPSALDSTKSPLSAARAALVKAWCCGNRQRPTTPA